METNRLNEKAAAAAAVRTLWARHFAVRWYYYRISIRLDVKRVCKVIMTRRLTFWERSRSP